MKRLIRSLAAMGVLALLAIAPSVEAFFLHFGGGVSAQTVTAVTVAAAGTTQAGATALAAQTRDNVTTGTGGVALSSAAQNNVLVVCNQTSAQILVYPANGSGNTIGPLGANKPMPLGTNVCQTFMAKSATAWTYQEGQCGSGYPIVFRVPCYGAIGDGVTDDTAAIQAAETAAEALCCGGTVQFPSANYLISTGPITVAKGGIEWRCLGGVSDGTSSNIPGATLMNNANGTLVDATFNAGASQSTQGPQFWNCNFNQASGTSRGASTIGLHIEAFLNGHVHGGGFQNFNNGIQFDCTVAQDNSNWIIDGHAQFFNNATSVSSTGSNAACGGTFSVVNNYLNIRLNGDVGVLANGGNGSEVLVMGNRVDGSTSGTPMPLNYFVEITGQTTAIAARIIGNQVEDPALLWLNWNGQSQGIRGVKIADNTHISNSAPNIVATCTLTGSGVSNLTSCTATSGSLANIVTGMCVSGPGLSQLGLGTYTNNTYASTVGGTSTSGVASGSTVPITPVSLSTQTAQSYTFSYPGIRVDHQTADTNPIIIHGNSYSSDNNGGTGCQGWTDGQ